MAASVISTTIEVNSKQAEQAVGSIKGRLKEARNELTNAIENFGEFSNEAVRAAKKVEALKGTIDDASRLVKSFDGDRKFAAFGGALSGVASGFAAAQGAIGLFGTESKEVEAALLKVNSAMALSQGIDGVLEARKSFLDLGKRIKDATIFQKIFSIGTAIATTVQKAFGVAVNTTSIGFKALRAAIISTGIGALVVLIGTVISSIVDWIGSTEDLEKSQERLKAAVDATNKSIDQSIKSNNRATDEAIALAKSLGKSEKEIYKIRADGSVEDERLTGVRLRSLYAFYETQEGLFKKGKIDEEKFLSAKNDYTDAYSNYEDLKSKQRIDKYNEEGRVRSEGIAATDKASADGKRRAEENTRSAQAKTQKEIDDFKQKNQTIIELAQIAGTDTIAIRNRQIDEEIALIKSKGPKFAEGIAALEKEKVIAAAKAVANGEQKSIDALKLKNKQIIELAEIAGQKTVDIRAMQIDEEIALIKSKTGNFTEAIAELEREKVVAGAQAAADAKAKEEEKKAARETLVNELRKLKEDTELADLKTKFDAEFALLEGNEIAQKTLKEKFAKENADITKKYADEEAAVEQAKFELKQKLLDAVANALTAASDVVGRETATGKAFAVAASLISTYSAIAGQLAKFSGPKAPPIPGYAIAQAIATGLVGFAAVRNILKTKVPGNASGGGGGAGVPIASTIAAPVAPQADRTRLDQSQINQIGNASARAFVVESDITGNQEKIRRLNRQARIN